MRRLLPLGVLITTTAGILVILGVIYDWDDAVLALAAIGLFGGVCLLAAIAAVWARRVLRLITSTQKYARLSSERTAAIRPAVANVSSSLQEYARVVRARSRQTPGPQPKALRSATPTTPPPPRTPSTPKATPKPATSEQTDGAGAILVLAMGDAAESPELDRFLRSNEHGEVLLVTDRATLVPRLARDVVVEYLPAASDGGAWTLAAASARLVELAVEHRSTQLLVWPDADRPLTVAGDALDDLSVFEGRALRSLLQTDTGIRERLETLEGVGTAVGRLASDSAASTSRLMARSDGLQKSIDSLGRSTERQRNAAVREVRSFVDDVYRQFESLTHLYRRFDGQQGIPAMRGWAVSPDLALDLVDRVLSGQVGNVVELGGGASTVLFALAFEQVGDGSITSLDHDAGYLAQTQELLDHYGVAHRARLIHAPLVEMEVDGDTYRWYGCDLRDLPTEVDLLFVDGPPEATGPMSRYPALPVLAPLLAPEAQIVLDDGRRPDETEIVSLWSKRDDVVQVTTMPHERKPVLVSYHRQDPDRAQ